MEENKNIETSQKIIDLGEISRIIWTKRKVFLYVWPIVLFLSCLWIFPQPRFYACEVALAPENGEGSGGGLAGLASSFGINLGDMATNDAIYPTLYPDLFESPEFLVDLMSIHIKTADGTIDTDYYTYMKKHQKQNWLTKPFLRLSKAISSIGGESDVTSNQTVLVSQVNSFQLSKKDYELLETIKEKIKCTVDKKTDVITINVQDQDKLVCALLADSIRERLQSFIIDYRTKKVRQDELYYKHLTDSARLVYEKALSAYGAFQDGHRYVVLQSYVESGEKIKNDLDTKLQAYNTFNTQYQAMKAKVQERIPSFTTLKSATVPQKPAGPKRMVFVLVMLILSTVVTAFWVSRNNLFNKKS